MADVLTMRQMRDAIRTLRLNKRTAVEAALDAGLDPMAFGGPGEPSPNEPDPTNLQCNLAIHDTISDINIKARLGGGDKTVALPIAAQTANGPYRVNLQTDFFPREAQINEVKRVWWGTGNTPLRWTSQREQDALGIDFMTVPPALPQQCWTNNYGLYLLPAPSTADTLYALLSTALQGPVSDDDIIPQLPADLYPVVLDGAGYRLCATQPDDAVMQERAKILGPRYLDGINDIKITMGPAFGQSAPRFIALSYRTRRGSR